MRRASEGRSRQRLTIERPPVSRPAALFVLALAVAGLSLPGCEGRDREAGPERVAPSAAAGGRTAPTALPETPETAADPSQGKWASARAGAPSAEELANLRAIPYLQGYEPAQDRPIVVEHDPAAAYQGLNLYVSGHAAEAFLLDMKGRVLHRWRYPLRRLWPDLAADPRTARLEYWRRAYLYPNGDLLAIYEGEGIVKLDARSNVLWAHRGRIHHDLFVTDGGRIWVLDRRGRSIPRIRPDSPVLEDLVTLLDPRGRVIRRISVLESLERSAHAHLLQRIPPDRWDIFHTNTLEVLDGRFASRHPAFRRGNLLLSILELDALVILDPRQEKIVWALSGGWEKQHQPSFLDNGNLLLFDNLGAAPDRSRLLEIDPLTGDIAWQFGGTPEVDFFSMNLGSCQRLPNGNTLVSESRNGRAFEVTPEGRIVWEFYNPQRAGERDELVAVLFEMLRLPPDFPFRGLAG